MNPTRTLLVTAAASGLLVGAAATAGLVSAGSASAVGGFTAAASPTPAPSPKAAPGTPRQKGPLAPGHGRFGDRGGFGGLRGAGPVLHGEFVIGGQNGSTRTVVVQTGTVTVKNGSLITVTSTDGYTVQWTLNDSTKVRTGWSQGAVKDIAQGDTVRVQGTKSGNTTTAELVAERPKDAPTTPRNGSSGGASPSGA
jgi:hypothetical protein